MSRGKYICKELKEVRRRIAEENGIPLEIKECTYEGPCRGTCPRCEAEVRYLENALANRLRFGKVATVAGLALGLASCGVQTEGEAPCTDTLPSDDTAGVADTMRPEVPEGPETSIEVPEVGEMVVTGDVADVPPPPPDTALLEVGGIDDDDFLLGVIAEDEPVFPGGMEAMYKFLEDNIKYPQLALENNIQGRVYVSFVVEKDGSISNPILLRDIGGGCGQEAIRVVKMMPKWTPGMQSGKPVPVQFNLPVNFVLPQDRMQIIEDKALPIQGKPAAPPVNESDNPGQDTVKVIVK